MNWTLALPEIVLAIGALLTLVVCVTRRSDSSQLACMAVIALMLVAGVLVVSSPYGVGYNGLFSVDAFAVFAKVLILTGAVFALILSLEYNRREDLRRFEFPILILLASVGMMLMVSATNLMSLYIGLELQSLAIYVLAAFARDDVRSSEAGLKYFVLGSLASGLLLYGSSMIYGFSGTLDFSKIAQALATSGAVSPGVIVGIVFVISGLAFKISAAPFHMWAPDVYEGAPTPVTAFMATAPKAAAMALLMRVLVGPFGHAIVEWRQVIEVISVISMLLGSLAAIAQWNIKRLMAYSSIGHMGYALIGLVAGTQAGVRGVLLYMATYVVMSAGAFACIAGMRRRGKSLEKIEDLSGIARHEPMLAFVMAVMMFSMAGVPPMSGFFGKLYVFMAAVQAGMYPLAVFGVLTSVIGAYYYLRVVKVMYFDQPVEAYDTRAPSVSFVAALTCLVTGFFFLFLSPVISAAQGAAQVLFG